MEFCKSNLQQSGFAVGFVGLMSQYTNKRINKQTQQEKKSGFALLISSDPHLTNIHIIGSKEDQIIGS